MGEEEINPQKNRKGDTIITSVSVSRKFAQLIEEYNLSPTECFRRGVAVTLCDLGIPSYVGETNQERLKYVQDFVREITKDEKLKEDYERIKNFESVRNYLQKIKQLIKEIENVK